MINLQQVRTMAGSPFDDEHYELMKALLKERVGKHRYKHSKGVAKTAKRMAKIYGVDPLQARMAGLVHDWDKGMAEEKLQAKARALNLDLPSIIIDEMPWLLHGYTAAASLKQEYPELGEELFSAVSKHTTGAIEMSPLDCILYTADIIEPGRDYASDSDIEILRSLVGAVSVEDLYFQAFKFTLFYLLKNNRALFPGTNEIWNAWISRNVSCLC